MLRESKWQLQVVPGVAFATNLQSLPYSSPCSLQGCSPSQANPKQRRYEGTSQSLHAEHLLKDQAPSAERGRRNETRLNWQPRHKAFWGALGSHQAPCLGVQGSAPLLWLLLPFACMVSPPGCTSCLLNAHAHAQGK